MSAPHETIGDRSEYRPGYAVHRVRRMMIVAVVGSLTVAAALGILALLSGEFGELQARIVLTTTTVAAFGTTSLCHLAVVTRSVRAVGFTGIAASLAAAGCALVLVWGDWEGDGPDELWWKSLGVLAVVAFSLAQANLLLLLAGRAHPGLRACLTVTLLAVAGVAVLVALPILTDGRIPGDDDAAYWRLLGVLGILDALGTIALPVLGLVLRRRAAEPGPDGAAGRGEGPGAGPSSTVRLVLDLPADLAARLDDAGPSREAAAVAVLRRGLAP